MLGIGLRVPRLYQGGLAKWLAAFIKRAREDGAVIEGKKCIEKDGKFLIENKRANIIVDYMGAYAVTQGGEGLEARACSAQEVNDLLYSPMPQTRFLFRAYDEGTKLENYYCLSNAIDILEGDLGIEGEVTHAYTSTGEIAVFPKNGVAPYTYSWSNGATTSEIIGLKKGEYRVQVKDAEGAIANHAFLVLGNEELTIVTAGLKTDLSFDATPLSFPAQGSAEFNGTSDYVQLPDTFSYTNHTIAAWCYVNDDANQKYIFDNRDATDDGIILGFSNVETFYYSVNTADRITTDTFANEWVFITGTYDGTTQKLYINGSVDGTNTTSQTISNTTDARIGAQSFSSANYFEGNLANVAIWNRALSSDEINSVMWKSYEALTSAESNGLQAWYSLDDITSPAASLANMEQLATDKNATIENKAAITAAINALS